ncbi:hypothetical protein P4530_03225 [Bacillus thuringiensis]|nr:hypothetical protein [Bacillus thuringiensis]
MLELIHFAAISIVGFFFYRKMNGKPLFGLKKGKQLVDEIKEIGVEANFVKTDMRIEKDVINFVDFAVRNMGKLIMGFSRDIHVSRLNPIII